MESHPRCYHTMFNDMRYEGVSDTFHKFEFGAVQHLFVFFNDVAVIQWRETANK